MNIFFLIQQKWNKPELTENELALESKKQKLEQKMEELRSRIQSIELLASNSKYTDVNILGSHLQQNYLEVLQEFEVIDIQNGQSEDAADLKSSQFKIKSCFPIDAQSDGKEILSTQKQLDQSIRLAKQAMIELNNLWSRKKSWMQTKLDVVKSRFKTFTIIVTIVILLILFGYVFKKVNYPELHADKVEMHYKIRSNNGDKLIPLQAVDLDLNQKGQWVDYKFHLPYALQFDLTDLIFTPLNQSKMRIALATLQYKGINGQTLFSRDFITGPNFLIHDAEHMPNLRSLVRDKKQPGSFIELLTTCNDPIVHFKPPAISGVKLIVLRMRVTEKYNRFID